MQISSEKRPYWSPLRFVDLDAAVAGTPPVLGTLLQQGCWVPLFHCANSTASSGAFPQHVTPATDHIRLCPSVRVPSVPPILLLFSFLGLQASLMPTFPRNRSCELVLQPAPNDSNVPFVQPTPCTTNVQGKNTCDFYGAPGDLRQYSSKSAVECHGLVFLWTLRQIQPPACVFFVCSNVVGSSGKPLLGRVWVPEAQIVMQSRCMDWGEPPPFQ